MKRAFPHGNVGATICTAVKLEYAAEMAQSRLSLAKNISELPTLHITGYIRVAVRKSQV